MKKKKISIKSFFKVIFRTTQKGFYFICLLFSRGFYFYFYSLALLFKKIFKKSKTFGKIVSHYKSRQENPEYFLLLVFSFVMIFCIFTYIYQDTNEIVKLDEQKIVESIESVDYDETEIVQEEAPQVQKKETNLFKKYGNTQLHQVDFNSLRQDNSQVVSWLSVDGTNINYPIVQTTDNDYYLKHSINNAKKGSGWTFMDYRNDSSMLDDNTIFYGHNLLNKTGFGSISNIFTEDWFNSSNHKIIVLTDYKIYTYQIFSAYYIGPESYYLQTNFVSDDSRGAFFTELKNRTIVNFGLDVAATDKIITLSTCTEDNKGRKVIHAKLISEIDR